MPSPVTLRQNFGGWTYETRVDTVRSYRAVKDVVNSPPGKARMFVEAEGQNSGEVKSLDTDRVAPGAMISEIMLVYTASEDNDNQVMLVQSVIQPGTGSGCTFFSRGDSHVAILFGEDYSGPFHECDDHASEPVPYSIPTGADDPLLQMYEEDESEADVDKVVSDLRPENIEAVVVTVQDLASASSCVYMLSPETGEDLSAPHSPDDSPAYGYVTKTCE